MTASLTFWTGLLLLALNLAENETWVVPETLWFYFSTDSYIINYNYVISIDIYIYKKQRVRTTRH